MMFNGNKRIIAFGLQCEVGLLEVDLESVCIKNVCLSGMV